MVNVRVWSDFVWPWCYVGLGEAEKLRKEYDVHFDWRPFLLRPDTPPQGSPVPEYVQKRWKDPDDPLKKRAAALGLKMVPRQIIPSTRRAHEAAEFAREQGRKGPMHAALLRRYWSEGQDLWSLETLRGAAVEAGLEPDGLQKAIEEGRYRPAVEEALREAQEAGIDARPTVLFDDPVAAQRAHEDPRLQT